MRVGKRLLKPETVTWLREVLQEGELTRSAIAREQCERDGWKNRQGVPCAASARTALALPATLRLALRKPAPTRIRPTGSATLRIADRLDTRIQFPLRYDLLARPTLVVLSRPT